MKLNPILIPVLFFFLLSTSIVVAQDGPGGERAQSLRWQLLEIEERTASLRMRLQQLDEDLKPENIERALAGIGSTRPEELREERRRQLSIQRDNVLAQIRLLESSHSRLESAIASADVHAARVGAMPTPPPIPLEAEEQTGTAQPVENLRSQLIDVQAKIESLQIRSQLLDEELKPENIERSLAGIGSTHPEELREQRRQQLTLEKGNVLAQLKLLDASKASLQNAIAAADVRANRIDAMSTPVVAEQMLTMQTSRLGWPVLSFFGGIVILAIGAGIIILRRLSGS